MTVPHGGKVMAAGFEEAAGYIASAARSRDRQTHSGSFLFFMHFGTAAHGICHPCLAWVFSTRPNLENPSEM